MNNELSAMFSILKELNNTFEHSFKSRLAACINARGATQLDIVLGFFLAKTSKTTRSIVLLVENGFGEEAVVLSRTIFESLVNMHYILHKDTDTRIKLFCDFGPLEVTQKIEKTVKSGDAKAEECLIGTIHTDSLMAAKEFRSKYLSGIKHPKSTSWSGLSLWQMCKELNFEIHYNKMYWLNSQIAHPHPALISNYVTNTDNNISFCDSPGLNELDCALFCSSYYYYAMLDLINTTYNMQLTDQLQKHMNQLVSRDNNSTKSD